MLRNSSKRSGAPSGTGLRSHTNHVENEALVSKNSGELGDGGRSAQSDSPPRHSYACAGANGGVIMLRFSQH